MRWREFIQYNFWWKAAAVGLATLIWLTVRFGENGPGGSLFSAAESRHIFDVPVRVITVASDASRFRVTPDKVEVVLRGDAGTLHRVLLSDLEAYVNLADVESTVALLMPIHVFAPPGLRVESVIPAKAHVEKLSDAGDSDLRPN